MLLFGGFASFWRVSGAVFASFFLQYLGSWLGSRALGPLLTPLVSELVSKPAGPSLAALSDLEHLGFATRKR